VRQEKEATVGKKHCMSGMVVNKRQCHRISVVVFCIDFK